MLLLLLLLLSRLSRLSLLPVLLLLLLLLLLRRRRRRRDEDDLLLSLLRCCCCCWAPESLRGSHPSVFLSWKLSALRPVSSMNPLSGGSAKFGIRLLIPTAAYSFATASTQHRRCGLSEYRGRIVRNSIPPTATLRYTLKPSSYLSSSQYYLCVVTLFLSF